MLLGFSTFKKHDFLVCSPLENMARKQCFLVCPPLGNMARKQCFLVCPPLENMARKQCFLVCPPLENMAVMARKQCFLVCPPLENMARKQCFLVCPPLENVCGWETMFPGLFTCLGNMASLQSVYFSDQQHDEEQTENVFKVLSRPKSINSFYNHEAHVKRQKARPKTAVPGNVLPSEPEQPKAHPRITSGKPRPPTRGMIDEQ
jgi:hypothetical protein